MKKLQYVFHKSLEKQRKNLKIRRCKGNKFHNLTEATEKDISPYELVEHLISNRQVITARRPLKELCHGVFIHVSDLTELFSH